MRAEQPLLGDRGVPRPLRRREVHPQPPHVPRRPDAQGLQPSREPHSSSPEPREDHLGLARRQREPSVTQPPDQHGPELLGTTHDLLGTPKNDPEMSSTTFHIRALGSATAARSKTRAMQSLATTVAMLHPATMVPRAS